jgi:subtilisin family serine protease
MEESAFLKNAQGHGLHKLKRLPGTNWLIMSIPGQAGFGPREAAAKARGLPGVIRAAADPIMSINVAPQDPFYSDDADPDLNFDPDQWGLFRVSAESGWDITTGNSNVVIAIVDSGVDFDHDDLFDKIWTNLGEAGVLAENGSDDDGNGYVDDVHGWDFSGSNAGDLSDVPVPGDNLADIPEVGEWHQDLSLGPLCDWDPFGCWWFDGDPAVGDLIDNNQDGYYDIGVFHGTFTAGIAAAMTDNIMPGTAAYEGMAGACQNCKLMPLRIINAEGAAFGSDAAEAIRYAVDNGANVINASWGIAPGAASSEELAVLTEAIEYAVSKEVIIVAAAGNSGTAGLHFPSNLPQTISVGSSDPWDGRSSFSSYADTSVGDLLDVVAPGQYIWSTYVTSPYDAWILNGWPLFDSVFDPTNPQVSGYPSGDWMPGTDAYSMGDGTSFATPLVSGYVGLILSHNPCATPSDVRQVLQSNSFDIGTPGYDAETGYGRINMIVPDLGCLPGDESPGSNLLPVANAGLDQIITDKGKPGEKVTLDGSGSNDPDGSIVSYQWFENGQLIAEGVSETVDLAGGSHTITLEVTDDAGESTVDTCLVNIGKDENGGGGGSGKPDKPGNGGGKPNK